MIRSRSAFGRPRSEIATTQSRPTVTPGTQPDETAAHGVQTSGERLSDAMAQNGTAWLFDPARHGPGSLRIFKHAAFASNRKEQIAPRVRYRSATGPGQRITLTISAKRYGKKIALASRPAFQQPARWPLRHTLRSCLIRATIPPTSQKRDVICRARSSLCTQHLASFSCTQSLASRVVPAYSPR